MFTDESLVSSNDVTIPAKLRQRIAALAIEDADLLEASTAHGDDLVRLEDRYGRLGSDGTDGSSAEG